MRYLLVAALYASPALAVADSVPLQGRLCVTDAPCVDYVCGQSVEPQAASRLFTIAAPAKRTYVLGVLGPGEATIPCATSTEVSLRVTAGRPLPRRSSWKVFVADADATNWELQLNERDAAAPVLLHLPRGSWDVSVTAPGFIPARRKIVAAGSAISVSAELVPLPALSGVVKDRRTGLPVAGALLRSDVDTSAISDGAGSFRLEADPEKWPSRITVQAGGYAETTSAVPEARVSATLDPIELTRGGTIVLELKQPEAGSVLATDLQSVRDDGHAIGTTIRTLAVPEDGTSAVLRFENIEPGEYIILARGRHETERFAARVHVNTGEESKLNIRIEPFHLHLRTEMDGSALAPAQVVLTNRDVLWQSRAVMESSGEATVTLWQGGRLKATAEAAGILPYIETRTIETGEDASWTLRIPSYEITGRVIDSATEKPVPRAGLVLRMESEQQYLLSVQTTAAEDGTFRFAPVVYGRHTIKAAASGYPPVETRYVFVSPEQSRNLTIRLEHAAMVRLTVVDSRRLPVAGARVMDFAGLVKGGGVAFTDPSGVTQFPVPPTGARDMFVVPRDGSFGFVRLTPGAETASVRIEDGVCRIVLRTETTRRKPIPGISVVIRYNGQVLPLEVIEALSMIQGARTRSDGNGRIVLDHMPAGTYEFWPVGSPAELRALAAGVGPQAPVRIVAGPGENEAVLLFDSAAQP